MKRETTEPVTFICTFFPTQIDVVYRLFPDFKTQISGGATDVTAQL